MPDPRQELEDLKLQLGEFRQRLSRLENALLSAPDTAPRAAAPGAPGTVNQATPPAAAPGPQSPPKDSPQLSPAPAPRPLPAVSRPPAPPPESLESRIGARLFNRLGIVAMIVGSSYFMKLAIEKSWLGPASIVTVGILSGIGIMLWAGKLQSGVNKYFSYSLTVIGAGILYLSFWAAFNLYHLVSAPAAFVAMIAVTATTIAIAFHQDSEFIAAVALLGGFSTPVLLSTGENHPFVLFPYVILLDLAMLWLVAQKPWQRLLLGGFCGTHALYLGWYARHYSESQYSIAMLFSTLFFLLFFNVPLLKRLYEPAAGVYGRLFASRAVLVVTLLNPFFYYTNFYYLNHSEDRAALLALVLCAGYLAAAGFLRAPVSVSARSPEASAQHLVMLALAIKFFTVAIVVKFDDTWTVFALLVESAALFYAVPRTGIKFLGQAAAVIFVIAVNILLLSKQFASHLILPVIVNRRFFAYMLATAIMAAVAVMAWRSARPTLRDSDSTFVTATLVANLLALLGFSIELRNYWAGHWQSLQVAPGFDWHAQSLMSNFSYSALWMLFAAALMLLGFLCESSSLRWESIGIFAATIIKVFIADVRQLSGAWRVLSIVGLGALLLAVSYAYQRDWLQLAHRDLPVPPPSPPPPRPGATS